MKALQQHRESFPDKSDEWLFERLDLELKSKVNTIHELLTQNERFQQLIDEMEHVNKCDCQNYEAGLVSNSCPIHNENPYKRDT